MEAFIRQRDVFLLPGEVHFSDEPALVKTILGSCIAIAMWHPQRKLAGMCHFVLPDDFYSKTKPDATRYCTGAILALFKEALRHDTEPHDYEFGMYGGGFLVHENRACSIEPIGSKNIRAARTFLDKCRIFPQRIAVGGPFYRNITLNTATGELRLRETLFSRDIEGDTRITDREVQPDR